MLDKFLEVNSLILAIFGVSIFGVLLKILDALKQAKESRYIKQEQVNQRFENLELAQLAMLHNKIYRQCAEHLEAEYISIEDLDDLDYLFRGYKGLGGNGTGETLYNKVKALPNTKKAGKKNEIKK